LSTIGWLVQLKVSTNSDMQISNATTPKPTEPKSILLIGPPGSGKTALSMQFPRPAFMDCDRNLDGPEAFVRSKSKDLSYGYEKITYDEDNKPVPVHLCFDRLLTKLVSLNDNSDYSTVIVDGLTMVNEFIIQKILVEQRKSEMEARHWQPFKSNMINLLVGKLRGLGKTTICTCHESIVEKPNPDPKKIMDPVISSYRPAVQGGITDYFGGFFTDMWRCTAEAAPGGKVEYKIQTIRDPLSNLKSSFQDMPNEIVVRQGELAFAKLLPYMKGLV
jgi:hypothetical protein